MAGDTGRVTQRGWQTWRVATERALYGPEGFYRSASEGPRDHFRTSVHASPLFARAVLTLAHAADLRQVVDVGAGRGELLSALHALDPALRLVGVEKASRPTDLADDIEWVTDLPTDLDALLVANEWLDNLPVDVVEQAPDGARLVEVDATGAERLDGPPSAADAEWLATWWPLTDTGHRAEVGRPRDDAWASAVSALRRGVALAVDYAHTRDDRPPHGSLTGYRHGRLVRPVPDGSCDLTSHVALDACAVAGRRAGATATTVLTQRAALHALGVRGTPPDPRTADADPTGYLRALRDAGEAAELTAAGGLGDFTWLVQSVATELPPPLRQDPVTGTER